MSVQFPKSVGGVIQLPPHVATAPPWATARPQLASVKIAIEILRTFNLNIIFVSPEKGKRLKQFSPT